MRPTRRALLKHDGRYIVQVSRYGGSLQHPQTQPDLRWRPWCRGWKRYLFRRAAVRQAVPIAPGWPWNLGCSIHLGNRKGFPGAFLAKGAFWPL